MPAPSKYAKLTKKDVFERMAENDPLYKRQILPKSPRSFDTAFDEENSSKQTGR